MYLVSNNTFFCIFSVIPPFFEADYLEIVKDLPEISLGPSSGYNYTRKLSVHGPDAFPVVTDNDGYAYIVAGKFGKVSTLVPLLIKLLSGETLKLFKTLVFT